MSSDVCKLMQWISTICWCSPGSYFMNTKISGRNMLRASAMCWSMSFKTPTLCSKRLSRNSPASSNTSVWWATMRRAFMVFVARTSITFLTFRTSILNASSLSWSRTIVQRKILFKRLIASFATTSGRFPKHRSAKMPSAKSLFMSRCTAIGKRLRSWGITLPTLCGRNIATTPSLPFSIAPTRRAEFWKRNCSSKKFLIASLAE